MRFVRCRHVFWKTSNFVFIVFLLTFAYFGFNRFSTNVFSNGIHSVCKSTKTNGTKYILYWTPFWHIKDYALGTGFKPFVNCEYKNCYSTFDKKLLPVENYDALIFHGIRSKERVVVPSVRKPHQYYIFMNVEAPAYICPDLKPYNSFYNWTMTYRFDSDIIRRHGAVTKMETSYKLPSKEAMQNKTKLVAWFVSNCKTPSRREVLAEEIEKFTEVDVYGHCGNLSCAHKKTSRKLSSDECYAMVERDYKFYFAFENSYCKDYSTEKLYKILERNVVPVVYGAGDYNLSAPPNSVINVENYDNVSQLVDYLNFLDKNDDEYLKYFDWKRHYSISSSTPTTNCELCRKLHEEEQFIYDDIYTWWWGAERSLCKLNKKLPEIVSNLL